MRRSRSYRKHWIPRRQKKKKSQVRRSDLDPDLVPVHVEDADPGAEIVPHAGEVEVETGAEAVAVEEQDHGVGNVLQGIAAEAVGVAEVEVVTDVEASDREAGHVTSGGVDHVTEREAGDDREAEAKRGTVKSVTAVKIPRNEKSTKEKARTENRMKMRRAIERRRKYPNKK